MTNNHIEGKEARNNFSDFEHSILTVYPKIKGKKNQVHLVGLFFTMAQVNNSETTKQAKIEYR